MTVSEKSVNTLAQLIADLYEQLLVKKVPEDALYLGYLDSETQFGLDEQGYRVSYTGILREIFALPDIGEKWSHDGLQELGHKLLIQLAEHKAKSLPPPDFDVITREWLAQVDIKFEQHRCFSTIEGLSVELPIEVGNVKFLPIDIDLPELKQQLTTSYLEKFNSFVIVYPLQLLSLSG